MSRLAERKGGSLPDVRHRNRVHIRQAIYRGAPITRTEIADQLGLTLPTITTSVAQMLEEGLLLEEPMSDAEYQAGQGGRRPLMLRFSPEAGYALGVELGPYETSIVLTDLTGTPIERALFPQASPDYAAMLADLASWIAPFLTRVPKEKFLGVGLGTPGFVNDEDGSIRASFRSGWNGKNIAADLGDLCSVPVIADNNVRMRAIGQQMRHGKNLPDLFAYLFVSKGIACPLMIDRHILSGSTFGAGEIGHMVLQPDGPICPTCGRRGCLEALTGETAVRRDCASLLQFGRAPILRKLAADVPDPDIKTILAAQRAGDPDVTEVLDKAIDYLGLALANVVNLISPAQVLVDGYLLQSEENRTRLLESARSRFYGLNAREVQIRFLPFDRFSGSVGAATAVIDRNFIRR